MNFVPVLRKNNIIFVTMINDPDSNSSSANPRTLKVWIPLLMSLMVVGGMVIGMKMQKIPLIQTKGSHASSQNNSIHEGSKIEELLRYIENRYVDEIDRDKLVDKAIRTILDDLDPHSSYIDAEHIKQVNEQLQGNFEGVGIEFLMVDDTILVVSPISGGPSDKVSILANDKIISIEDSIVAGVNITFPEIVNKLRGERGTTVNVGIKRRGENELLYFDIERDEIPINSVDIAYMLDEKTGYIKVNRFSATTHIEFMDSLEYMVEKEGLKDLVIDLRQNPGGYLQEATKMLSQLFDENQQLLVYTEGRTVKRNDYETTGRAFFEIENIALLIDEGSASASEIMAGAIQDWDRGVVVGRRSFGKGLVQEQYTLRDGSALRLTVARYFTPTGRSIQKSYEPGNDYDGDIANRVISGELFSQDSIVVLDTLKYYTKKDKRVVYGGGGITPDIFVPVDSLELNRNFLELQGHIPQFVYRQLENQTERFKDYSINSWIKSYRVTDQMINDLANYAGDKGVEISSEELREITPMIRTRLKARVARQYYGEEGSFKVLNQADEVVKNAIKALKEKEPVALE